MHADELDVTTSLVRGLLAAQFPEWAGLPLARVESAGTDNAIFRLGSDLTVRLPRYASAARQVAKEQRWVPHLAPFLPLPVPVPVGFGEPALGYPFPWSVCRWVDGTNPVAANDDLARDLAAFVTALRSVPAADGPAPGKHNFGRGVPLADRDALTREKLAACEGLVDVAACAAVWSSAVAVPAWDRPPVWVHGDLAPGNLLVCDNRLAAVIDFGGLGVGDPACDLQPAWNLLSPSARRTFRSALGVDDATWERGRGWALSVAIVGLPYYLPTSPAIVAGSLATIGAVLNDA
jgi:aminoglycoside phosphotransferase (APT) family kinase protein